MDLRTAVLLVSVLEVAVTFAITHFIIKWFKKSIGTKKQNTIQPTLGTQKQYSLKSMFGWILEGIVFVILASIILSALRPLNTELVSRLIGSKPSRNQAVFNEQIDDKTYVNQDYNFSIEFPQDWMIKDNIGVSDSIAKKAVGNNYSSIMITVVDDYMETYSAEDRETLKREDLNFSSFEDEELLPYGIVMFNMMKEGMRPEAELFDSGVKEISNKKFIFIKYKCLNELDENAIEIFFFTQYMGYRYLIGVTCLLSDFEREAPAINASIDSFSFINNF